MADQDGGTGRIVKMEVDYAPTCDEKIPAAIKMAAEGKFHDAIDSLLALEKQTRTVSLISRCFFLSFSELEKLFFYIFKISANIS
jgi:hypothetical protein